MAKVTKRTSRTFRTLQFPVNNIASYNKVVLSQVKSSVFIIKDGK